ncbi:hypothetical protein [Candidatus Solirubrobacter pratensis]|uniref:hypothetical protein n=1 Tax=Candidatus Solirubrobacter pratensis TaxID=1298857 RepID=UPI00041E2263|nr:hypothetical protein [Candidatus Solirubrobacter pratensis]
MRRTFVAIAAFFAFAAPAQADFSVTPSTTQAGAPADVAIHADFATSPASVALHLPPGLVGDPNAAARCPLQTFRTGSCPGPSRVGDASATTVLGPLSGGVYNLEPEPGEPARLGIAIELLGLIPLVRNEAAITLRPDGGLDSTIAQLQNGGFDISALDLTLDSSFMTLPTSCIPATTTIEAPPNAPQTASFTPTGCDRVPFTPSVSASLETTQRVVPSGATVALSLPAGQSHVRRAEIVLPQGTTLSPGVANGLEACTAAQFAGAGCPAGSEIGAVSFVTPLLGKLGGTVYFGDGFRLYILVAGSGVSVKLAGDVRLDPATGQITTVFDNLPQVPFTSFALTFQGGAHAVLANPPTCGPKTVSALLTPWSGTAPKTATASFTIDGCATAPAFAPALRVAAGSTAAGRPAGAVTLDVSRPDGSEDISRVTTQLPPGLAGSLKSVPVCADGAADAGSCPAETRVGSVTALAGSGAAPVTLAGTVSLTGPTDGGLAGLAIAIPGKVGPVDLGTVVVRAGIALRADGGLTVRTRPLPRLVGGVPVSIRELALTLDRPGFILNASSCAAQQVTAILDGAGGSQATVAAPYQATDCAGLRFAPRLEATVGARGKTGKGAAAPLHAVITVPDGQASTASADVALPKTIGIAGKRLNNYCEAPKLAAGACPASSRIGSAVATTPLLAAPLTSAVTLAAQNAGDLPGLSLTLTGPVTLPLFGKVIPPGADRRIHNVFAGIPDVPLERFDLSFTSAAPLTLQSDACHGARQRVSGTIAAHSGAIVRISAPLKVAGCPPVVALTRRGSRVTLRVTRGRDAPAVKRVTLNGRRAKTRTTTVRTARRTFRVVVRDAGGQTWTFKPKPKRR